MIVRTLTVCALLVAVTSAVFFLRSDAPALSDDAATWKLSFETSFDATLAEYQTLGRTLSYDEAHLLAHTVGEALYALKSIDAIGVCGSEFSYGCYHAVAGAALAESGPAGVNALKVACQSVGTGSFECVHGAGHGILSYTGENKLGEAFSLCEPFNEGVSDVGGCYGGIMMEYNFRTMQSPSGIDVRPLDRAHPEGPCADLESKYRSACYYELPAWWRANVLEGGELDYDWTDIGELCLSLPESARDACYRGVGNVVGPQSGYYTANMTADCAEMPDEAAASRCLEEALGHLVSIEGGSATIRSYCAKPGALPAFCRKHLDGF